MNREIKFRAWDKKHKEMIEWEQLKDEGDMSWFEDGDLIFMQYTGLKDKNGFEIYEGDIVKIIHSEYLEEDEEPSEYDITIGKVQWGCDYDTSYPAFHIPEFDSELNSFSEIMNGGCYEIEVIGDIYDNKELLNE